MPTRRTAKTKTSKAKKETSPIISRFDKLPDEIKYKIFYITQLKNKLEFRGDSHYNKMEYDYEKIIKKFDVEHDIVNIDNINDKRNFKKFNTKIDLFRENFVDPIINEYSKIYELFFPEDPKIRSRDFSLYLNNINIQEHKLRNYVKKLNKLLYNIKLKYNSYFYNEEIKNINKKIKSINKILKKPIPLIYIKQDNTLKPFKSFSNTKTKKSSISYSSIMNNITRKTRSV